MVFGFVSLKKGDHFVFVDFAAIVLIKHIKSCLEIVVTEERLGVHRGCEEFSVVYGPGLVGIGAF